MPAYTVTAPNAPGTTRVSGIDAVVVFAADEDDAVAMAKSIASGDSSGQWDNATVTEIAEAADMEGWQVRVTVSSPALAVVADVTVTAAAAEVLDDLGDALVTALNATASIANAAYVSATQTLTVAAGTGADDLGDHLVTCEFYPPAATRAETVAVPSFVSSITDGGVSTDDLTVVFAADANVVPSIPVPLRSVS